jgi:uncharacterized integral membrane protein
MRRLLFFIIVAPIAVLLIALAIANRHEAPLVLDPFSPSDPALAYALPLYLLLFGALILGVLLGGIAAWASQHRWRAQAREERSRARHFRREAEALRTETRADTRAEIAPGLPALSPPAAR